MTRKQGSKPRRAPLRTFPRRHYRNGKGCPLSGKNRAGRRRVRGGIAHLNGAASPHHMLDPAAIAAEAAKISRLAAHFNPIGG